jgi:hypothetical protein
MQHKRGAVVIDYLSLIGNAEKENEQGAVSCRSERRRMDRKTETRAVGRWRCAEVTETEGPILQTIWGFGKDLFPSSLGKPKKTRTRSTYRMDKLSY